MKSRFPFPPYPNGWFQIAYSDEVAQGAAVPLVYFGKELVLYRGEDGTPSLLDAHCAHLGAHLGHGGKVEGNCLVCPFHAWKYNGEGQCTEIPYAQRIPPRAKVRAWPIVEQNGMIYAWHHMLDEAPSWQLPVVAEFGDEEWTPYEKRRWKIKTRNQEMAENGVDSAHFRYLHGTANLPTARTEQLDHILHSVSDTVMTTPAGKVKGQIEVHAHGFGLTTTRFTGLVETLALTTVTAIDDDYCDVRFSFTVKKLGNVDATRGVGAAFIREIARQLEQDIPIWENKVYFDHPVLCDGDGPFGIFRRWCRQFYSEPTQAAQATG
jgi:phenylpropionate dioxygenase-like ring-hydroxylating dioxygenase large terminal subunit